jgi:isocitrate/isopropylmalate dehydrogenase
MSTTRHAVTVIPGDGIGPECVNSAIDIIEAVGIGVDWDEQHAGERVFEQGVASGVPSATIDSVNRTRVVLKGPLGTPVGYGEKSANVTLRKLFETYANIRPVRELPGVNTRFSGAGIDLVVVRENVEDLYPEDVAESGNRCAESSRDYRHRHLRRDRRVPGNAWPSRRGVGRCVAAAAEDDFESRHQGVSRWQSEHRCR